MLKKNLKDQIARAQDELSDLIIKVNTMPDDTQASVALELEKIARRLEELAEVSAEDMEEGTVATSTLDEACEPAKPEPEGRPLPWDERFHDAFAAQGGVFYEWDLQTGMIVRSSRMGNGYGEPLRSHFSARPEQASTPAGVSIPVSGAGIIPAAVWLQRIQKEERPKISAVFKEVNEGQREVYDLEYHIRGAGGKSMLLWDRAVVVRDQRGKPLRAVGVLEDITQLKQFEHTLLVSNRALAQSNKLLRQKEDHFRSVMENAPVAFFQTDLDLRYTWIYSPMLDLPLDQYIGKRDDEIFQPANAALMLALKQTALTTRDLVRREVTLTGPEEQRILFISAQPQFGNRGEICGVVGACVDLTQQRSLENRASEKAFQLELNRRLMEHEDQQRRHLGLLIQEGPVQRLSGVGFSIQLARQLFPSPESLEILEEIRSQVKSLVAELRDVSNELHPPAPARFGLERAFHSYIKRFQEKYPDIKIELAIEGSSAGLPDAAIQAIYHILEESLDNIAHHARASAVQVSLNLNAQHTLLEIADNGRGFEPQTDWMNLPRQGCYGLLRMKESAESTGGSLRVESAPGGGTRVSAEISREKGEG